MGREGARKYFLLAGALGSVALIAVLTLVLKKDSLPAELLLDYVSAKQIFPFPFTIQAVLWVVFGVGVGDLVHRQLYAAREARALALALLPEDDRTMLVAQDMPGIIRKLDAAAGDGPFLLTDMVRQSIHYFQANRSADQAHSLLGTLVDLELHRIDLRYTLVRYFGWLIPTLGFIGTVVGIAGALMALRGGGAAQAKMGSVVSSLATAFNTTILALVLSAILVVFLQFTQKREEETVNASSTYCVRNLVNRLYVPPTGA
jgi:biopolymer transport protein ExbB/TolQ